ncbi:PspC domain-containing protein [Liquorilactobacillus nagelii]|uniref:PspC domain-containing protein n=1 Tax=Liquorilactobacillus nagelii TaxID=82688 RepID=UPI001CCF411A|nr:PspC domain-containing protein [Liquorilactobacillus nagelii]ULQ50463.1 PspC domain-containing protein [Liquorilactobacillus nagelii]
MKLKEKKLRRSDSRLIAGVCGGLAEFLNFNPWIVRGIFLVLLVIPHIAWLVVSCYLILAISMPPKLGEKFFSSFFFELIRSLFKKESPQKTNYSDKKRKVIHDVREKDLKN